MEEKAIANCFEKLPSLPWEEYATLRVQVAALLLLKKAGREAEYASRAISKQWHAGQSLIMQLLSVDLKRNSRT